MVQQCRVQIILIIVLVDCRGIVIVWDRGCKGDDVFVCVCGPVEVGRGRRQGLFIEQPDCLGEEAVG